MLGKWLSRAILEGSHNYEVSATPSTDECRIARAQHGIAETSIMCEISIAQLRDVRRHATITFLQAFNAQKLVRTEARGRCPKLFSEGHLARGCQGFY